MVGYIVSSALELIPHGFQWCIQICKACVHLVVFMLHRKATIEHAHSIFMSYFQYLAWICFTLVVQQVHVPPFTTCETTNRRPSSPPDPLRQKIKVLVGAPVTCRVTCIGTCSIRECRYCSGYIHHKKGHLKSFLRSNQLYKFVLFDGGQIRQIFEALAFLYC